MPRQRFHCANCDAMRSFEQPPCADEHDAECPEWVCTVCGDAVLVAPVTLVAAHPSANAAGRVAPHQRRAA